MGSSFRLGFLTHLEGAGDPVRVYREAIELFVAAEALGFDVGWVAQHHFKADAGRLPAPLPFLAAVAERTRSLRLGIAVVVLPLEQPIRLAEDAAVVDLLSGGRLELGLGSGFDPLEFRAFGLEVERRRELTTQGLQALQRTLRGGDLGGGVRMEPADAALADRLWLSVYGAEGARYAAENGAGLLINRSVYDSDTPSDQIQVGWARAYLDVQQPAAPRIGLSRGIYPAADRRSALLGLREGVERFAEKLIQAGRVPAGQPLERYLQRLHVIYGHPEEVAAGLAADQVLPHTTDLILQFSPATPPFDQALRMLEQVATQIAPALGWRANLSANAKRPPGVAPLSGVITG
jgi:alkanesulfonate monooxygenase SsuD/methylene tetrahydromethanopterin reductase-like flavin-dependent oxidoreductase (luciferase family)